MEAPVNASLYDRTKGHLRFVSYRAIRSLSAVPLALLVLTSSCTEDAVEPVVSDQSPVFFFPAEVMTQWVYVHEDEYYRAGTTGVDGQQFKTRGKHVWAIISRQTTPTVVSCIVECTRNDTTDRYFPNARPGAALRDTVVEMSTVNFPVTISKNEIVAFWHWTIAIDARDSVALTRLPRDRQTIEVSTAKAKVRFETNVGLVEYAFNDWGGLWSRTVRLTLISSPTQ